MKVYLTAFQNKLGSGPMDFPEDTGLIIKLSLSTGLYKQFSSRGKEIFSSPPKQKLAIFQATNRVVQFKDLDGIWFGAREYQLTDIHD